MAIVEELITAKLKDTDVLRPASFTLIEGVGIEGDRYSLGQGTYSCHREKGRQLTLISADSVEGVLDVPRFSHVGVGDLRRSVVVRGMTQAELVACIGGEVDLGSCRVLVHRPCMPCMYLERRLKTKGLMEAIWNVCGVNCEIIVGGKLSVGDSVRFCAGTADPARADYGGKAPDFFVAPSARHVKAKIDCNKDDEAMTAWFRENEQRLLAEHTANVDRYAGPTYWQRAATVAAAALGTVALLRVLMLRRP